METARSVFESTLNSYNMDDSTSAAEFIERALGDFVKRLAESVVAKSADDLRAGLKDPPAIY